MLMLHTSTPSRATIWEGNDLETISYCNTNFDVSKFESIKDAWLINIYGIKVKVPLTPKMFIFVRITAA